MLVSVVGERAEAGKGGYLDVDGADLEVVDVREDRELDGAAPRVHLAHAGGVVLGLVAEDRLAVLVWMAKDVVGHLVSERPRGVLEAEGAAECGNCAVSVPAV